MLTPHLMMHQMACHHHYLQEGCPTLLLPHLSFPHPHLAPVSHFLLLLQVMMHQEKTTSYSSYIGLYRSTVVPVALVLDPEREDHGVGSTSHTEVP